MKSVRDMSPTLRLESKMRCVYLLLYYDADYFRCHFDFSLMTNTYKAAESNFSNHEVNFLLK